MFHGVLEAAETITQEEITLAGEAIHGAHPQLEVILEETQDGAVEAAKNQPAMLEAAQTGVPLVEMVPMIPQPRPGAMIRTTKTTTLAEVVRTPGPEEMTPGAAQQQGPKSRRKLVRKRIRIAQRHTSHPITLTRRTQLRPRSNSKSSLMTSSPQMT
jgi:hypothetical protein